MRIVRLLMAAVLGLLGLVIVAPPANAATQAVTMQNYAFSPSSLTIHVGDTVKWVFPRPADYHSSTSGVCTTGGGYYDDGSCTPDGTWDSGQLYGGQTFSRTFTTTGNFRYFCSVHLSMMTGTVQVDP